MLMVEDAHAVATMLTIIATLFGIPTSIYFANGLRLSEYAAYQWNARRYGQAMAQRHLYHPTHRYDLHAISDGTVLTAHGRSHSTPGTPVLTWSDNGQWTLTQTGQPYPIGYAHWNDLPQIDRLTELLDNPGACQRLAVSEHPEILTSKACQAIPVHTLSATLTDLKAALGADYTPSGGIAQLVRHLPSQKPVAVLLTLPDTLQRQPETLIQGMARRGWNVVDLDADPATICVTKASAKNWQTIAKEVRSPHGEPVGHRRW